MSRIRRLDYAYGVGRVRALEKYLIPEPIFREAAEAQDARASLKLVYDAGAYPEELIKVVTSAELDSCLAREEEKLKRLLQEILIERELVEAFLLDDAPTQALMLAQRAGYPFIINYVRQRIDTANIKIFFRAKYTGLSRERVEKMLLSGGRIPPRTFIETYGSSWTEAAESFRATPYGELWIRAVEKLSEEETFIGLERGIEDLLMSYLRQAKYITFGPEPIFSYGLARKKEIKLVRLLGLGKMLQIPVEMIKERMSATYV